MYRNLESLKMLNVYALRLSLVENKFTGKVLLSLTKKKKKKNETLLVFKEQGAVANQSRFMVQWSAYLLIVSQYFDFYFPEMLISCFKNAHADPCQGFKCESPKVCQVNAQREPECRCSYICPSETSFVCGSDGKTYTNQCFLTKQACNSRKEIRLLYNGQCTPGE